MEHHLFEVLDLITGHYNVFRYVSLSSLKNNYDAHQLIFQVVFLSLKLSFLVLCSISQVYIPFVVCFATFFPEAPPEIERLSIKGISEICPERAACLKGVDRLTVGRTVPEKTWKNWERSFLRF